jgi:mannose-1-phosphate guanylyltransferase/mannose-6-phosphate isomerase
VADEAGFTATLREAVRVAAGGAIVILGITPDRPETGYGYIRAAAAEPGEVAQVRQFVEKPDRATAERYLAEGGYTWNSGIFVLKASVWLAALEAFRPDIAAAVRTAWAAREQDGVFVRPGKEAFAAVPSESVDYAVLEKCPAAPSTSACCRWPPAGTTWAPGMPSGRWAPRTRPATSPRATCCCRTPATPWCTPPAAWSAWWA